MRGGRYNCGVRALLILLFAIAPVVAFAADVAPAVRAQAKADGSVDVLVLPASTAPRLAKRTWPTARVARLEAAHSELTRGARAHAPLVAWLEARRIAHRAFAVAGVVAARLSPAQLEALAKRPDVAAIVADAPHRFDRPRSEPAAPHAKAVESSVIATGAPTLWALGHRGQGIVVGGQDTGYQWNHPALRDAYRGWNGSSASHGYHWHDAIHGQVPGADASNPGGYDAPAPCDDDGHGTHTIGTAVGDDGGANQIGVAPDARWIGCRNMDQGWGRPSTYLECLEWFLAPTDANDANPDPSLAPHVIVNSWGCPPIEGCDAAAIAAIGTAIANLRAAGIIVVASAGNAGPACSTIDEPPPMYAEAFVVGAASNTGAIASFSSRGPVLTASGTLLKPDLTAPGVGVRSSLPTNAYGLLSGTSMAGPHVAGALALIASAMPRFDADAIEQALRDGASPRTQAQDCAGFPGSVVPNAVHGHGFLDVAASLRAVDDVFADGFE